MFNPQLQFEINRQLNKKLRSEYIPVDANIATIIGCVNSVLPKFSAKQLELVNLLDYKELVNPSVKGKIRMDILAVCVNIISATSPEVFGEEVEWYETTLEVCEGVADKWRVIKNAFLKKIETEVATKSRIIKAANEPKILRN